MQNRLLKKTLVSGMILLFLGASIVSAVNINVESTKVINEIENPSRDMKTFYPTDDASVKETAPYTNFGSKPLVVRNTYGWDPWDPWKFADWLLIKFDISELPIRVTIISATLNLFYYKWADNNPAGRTLTLSRAMEDWDENTVTWNTRPIVRLFVTSYATVPYSLNVWMEWDVTSDVKDFVKGTETNYGWYILDLKPWGLPDIPVTYFRQKESQINIGYLEIEYNKKSRNNDITNQLFLQFFEHFPILRHLLRL